MVDKDIHIFWGKKKGEGEGLKERKKSVLNTKKNLNRKQKHCTTLSLTTNAENTNPGQEIPNNTTKQEQKELRGKTTKK